METLRTQVEAAQEMVNTMTIRRPDVAKPLTSPRIESVNVVQEGNFTIVILNGTYTGVAKFNPRDVVTLRHEDKCGNLHEVEKSKYSAVAGIQKAMHRAATKMF